MFKNKKAIICDFDGTLSDSIGMWNSIDIFLLKKYTGKTVSEEEIVSMRDKCLMQNNTGDIYLNYAKYIVLNYALPISGEEYEKKRNALGKKYIIDSICFKDNADIFLKTAKAKGFRLGLATVGSRWCVDCYRYKNRNLNEKIDFSKIFEFYLSKDDVSSKKPNPEVYLKAIQQLGLNKEDCIVLEDSLAGITAARRAGLEVVCIYDRHSDSDRKEINQLATYLAPDYDYLLNCLYAEDKDEKKQVPVIKEGFVLI